MFMSLRKLAERDNGCPPFAWSSSLKMPSQNIEVFSSLTRVFLRSGCFGSLARMYLSVIYAKRLCEAVCTALCVLHCVLCCVCFTVWWLSVLPCFLHRSDVQVGVWDGGCICCRILRLSMLCGGCVCCRVWRLCLLQDMVTVCCRAWWLCAAGPGGCVYCRVWRLCVPQGVAAVCAAGCGGCVCCRVWWLCVLQGVAAVCAAGHGGAGTRYDRPL